MTFIRSVFKEMREEEFEKGNVQNPLTFYTRGYREKTDLQTYSKRTGKREKKPWE